MENWKVLHFCSGIQRLACRAISAFAALRAAVTVVYYFYSGTRFLLRVCAYLVTCRHPQNRKYITYLNATRGRSSHVQRPQKIWPSSAVWFSRYENGQTHRQTDRYANHSTRKYTIAVTTIIYATNRRNGNWALYCVSGGVQRIYANDLAIISQMPFL